MAIKKYRVTDEAENYIDLQVDTDVLTSELATHINNFWSGNKDRLDKENGDVVAVVVRFFGALALRFFLSEGGVTSIPLTHENSTQYWTNRVIDFVVEGLPSTSAALGIQLFDALVIVPEFCDVRLSEITS